MAAEEEENQTPASGRDTVLVKAAKYMAIALEFPSTVAAGLFLGYFLDQYFHTKPWLVLVLGLTGIVVGFYRMIVLLRHFSRDPR